MTTAFTVKQMEQQQSPLQTQRQQMPFLCHYENECLDNSPISFKPKLNKRYVKDILVMFRSKDHVKNFVDYMNTKYTNIHLKQKIKIIFHFEILDIKIIRYTEEKAFEVSVYRKSTFSGAFTNFKSFILITYKTGLLEAAQFGHCFTVFQYALSMKIFTRKLSSSKKSLSKISPRKIYRCIKNFLNKLHVLMVAELIAAKKELILLLPYLGQ